MNALAVEYAIEKLGRPAGALSALPIAALCESYSRQTALHHLAKTASSFWPAAPESLLHHHTGAALRGAELSCDAIMKATQVNWTYTADPKKTPRRPVYES